MDNYKKHWCNSEILVFKVQAKRGVFHYDLKCVTNVVLRKELYSLLLASILTIQRTKHANRHCKNPGLWEDSPTSSCFSSFATAFQLSVQPPCRKYISIGWIILNGCELLIIVFSGRQLCFDLFVNKTR